METPARQLSQHLGGDPLPRGTQRKNERYGKVATETKDIKV